MKKMVVVLISMVLLQCKSNVNQSNINNLDEMLIAKGNLYGAGAEGIKKQNEIITNTEEWSSLMSKMDTVNKVSEEFSETDIDFSEYSIIAVFDEVRNSGGHGLDLEIIRNSEDIVIEVIYDGPEGNATMVMTQPFYIAKIKKQDLPITFK
ncbi:protease complex subunit PrcB family protein [Sediminibacter sp. Hel_I_10]|uniref:protease complex subunit PrcB family protein n=1 Tax=Sediminibacter sp. Hel_I_10 TaxID=1392490 RepID=UPI00047A9000|nr:protease complex subunit PrcB family protein [Sediminibacter sp. Hel_I_10]